MKHSEVNDDITDNFVSFVLTLSVAKFKLAKGIFLAIWLVSLAF